VASGGTYTPVDLAGSPPRFQTPDFIFATQASKRSNRPVWTITPLASALDLTYDDKHADDDYGKVASDILTNSKYVGKIVLICWHHSNIPALATALGIASPPKWPTVFDLVWQITWPSGQATLSSQCQMLLYGRHDLLTRPEAPGVRPGPRPRQSTRGRRGLRALSARRTAP
jgi:hypothetical protein